MQSFEFMDIDVTSSAGYIKLVIIYHPPYSNKKKVSHGDCLAKFATFAIISDFNIYWDKLSDCNVKHFVDLIDSVNVTQHVRSLLDQVRCRHD